MSKNIENGKQEAGKEPIERIKRGNFSISLWNGENGLNITLQKSYKNNEGEWINKTLGFYPDEIPRISGLLREMEPKVEKCLAHPEA